MESGIGDSEWATKTPIERLRFEKQLTDALSGKGTVQTQTKTDATFNQVNFRAEDVSELKYMLDKNYASLRSRWGYKTPIDGSFKRAYGLDEFISDLSREMPGMEHLAEMHPAEALVEVDKLYTELQEQIKEKYESAYGDML